TDCWDEDPEKRPTTEFVLKTLNGVTERTITQAPNVSEIALDQKVDNSTQISSPVSSSIGEANRDFRFPQLPKGRPLLIVLIAITILLLVLMTKTGVHLENNTSEVKNTIHHLERSDLY